MQIPFLAWLFQGIPESIAVAAFVFSMRMKAFSWPLVLKVGLIQAVIVYVVRLMPLTPGVHVLILVTSLGVVSMIIGEIEFKKAAIYSAMILSFLTIFEFAFFGLLTLSGATSFAIMNDSVWIRILVSSPQVIAVFFLAYIVRKKGLYRKFDQIFRVRSL